MVMPKGWEDYLDIDSLEAPVIPLPEAHEEEDV